MYMYMYMYNADVCINRSTNKFDPVLLCRKHNESYLPPLFLSICMCIYIYIERDTYTHSPKTTPPTVYAHIHI